MITNNKRTDWNQVRINAAIAIMQGLMENGKVSDILDIFPCQEAKIAVKMADDLVEELKKPRVARKK